jgi:hypothetical protein
LAFKFLTGTPMNICVICEIQKYPVHKWADKDFVLERKNEFYPEEEFGDLCFICCSHVNEIKLNEYIEKQKFEGYI